MTFKLEISNLKEIIKHNQYYKAELLSANLIESGINPEKIILTRRDVETKNRYHDINDISLKYSYSDPENPYIKIRTGKDGIYDSIAEGLFFIDENSGKEFGKKQIIDRIRDNRDKERHIRKFMQLFEIEADLFRSYMYLTELEYDKELSYNRFCDFYNQYWDIISIMNRDDVIRMLQAIPYFSNIRGDLNSVAEVLSFIFQTKILIETSFVESANPNIPQNDGEQLILGCNFVLSSTQATEYEKVVNVVVSDIELDKCEDFILGGKNEIAINYLCEMLLEVNTKFQININPKEKCKKFYLSDSNNAAYLGVNTYI